MQLKAVLIGLLSASGALASSAFPLESTVEARDDKGLAKGATLRIMALGASITFGTGSDETGGYRKDLVDGLVKGGNKVKMVGSRKQGNFGENKVEGWPGLRIDELRDKALKAVKKYKPRIILLNVGTNDAVQNKDVDKAGERYEALLKDVLKEAPKGAVVVASTLVHNRKDDVDKRVNDINDQYKRVVSKLQKEKKRIVIVDMAGSDGPETKKEADQYSDDTHPNGKGYKKMADLWVKGIQEADRRGFVTAPKKAKNLRRKPKDFFSSGSNKKLLEDIRKIIQEEFKKVEKAIQELKDKKN